MQQVQQEGWPSARAGARGAEPLRAAAVPFEDLFGSNPIPIQLKFSRVLLSSADF